MDTRDGLSIRKWNPTTMRVKTSIAGRPARGRTPIGLARRLVHQKKINLGVIDLHDLQGPRSDVLTRNRLRGLGAFAVLAFQRRHALVYPVNPRFDRPPVRPPGNSARSHLALTCSIK